MSDRRTMLAPLVPVRPGTHRNPPPAPKPLPPCRCAEPWAADRFLLVLYFNRFGVRANPETPVIDGAELSRRLECRCGRLRGMAAKPNGPPH